MIARTDNCKGTCDEIEDQIDGQIIYIVQVLRRFKGPAAEDNIIYLKTATNEAACGISFNVGTVYLFNLGNIQSDRRSCPRFYYGIGLCSFPSTWKLLPRKLKNFVVTNSKAGQSLCKRRAIPLDS